MNFDCSIILCTHNPNRDYLSRALGSLKAQTLPKDRWELLLVDNASEERLDSSWDLSWHPNARHVREDELGLTAARLRGIRESKASVLVYVDDDNVLAPNYIATSLVLFESHPWLGVIGSGRLTPAFQKEPHPKFRAALPFLAIRNAERAIWSNNINDCTCFPWGAGLCVRQEIASQYVALLSKMNVNDCVARHGRELSCGEDDIFSFAAGLKGSGFGIFPELQITHLIPATRVSERYFLKLFEAHAFSHVIIRHLLGLHSRASQDSLSRLRSLLGAARNGLFSLRVEIAAQQGTRRAQRYISERDLKPISL
jgi:hypothetical protein